MSERQEVSVTDLVELLIEDEILIRNWERLYRSLKLPASDLVQLESSYKNVTITVRELFIKVFNGWVSQIGGQATVGKLTNHLKEEGFKDSADRLIDKYAPVVQGPQHFSCDEERQIKTDRISITYFLHKRPPKQDETPSTSKRTKHQHPQNYEYGAESKKAELIWFEIGKSSINFTGRSKEIEDLIEMFHGTELFITITGMGGIGKTELAMDLARRIREKTVHCIRLNGDTEQSFRKSINRLAQSLQIEIQTTDSKCRLRETADIFLDIISTAGKMHPLIQRMLIIIDNLDKENKKVETFLAEIYPSQCFVVVTSRNLAVLDYAGKAIPLQPLLLEESQDLIIKSIADTFEEDRVKLHNLLGGFPLAIQQSLAFIKKKQEGGIVGKAYGIQDYLQTYATERKKILDSRLNKIEHSYKETTLVTWNISIEKINASESIGPIAVNLLNYIAYMQSDDIDIRFLQLIYSQSYKNASEEVDAQIEEAAELIKEYSLIKVESRKISIHRLVQEVLQVSKSAETNLEILHKLISAIAAIEDTLQPSDMVHVITAWRHGLKINELLKEFCNFSFQTNEKLRDMCLNREMRELAEKSAKRLTEVFGVDDINTLRMNRQVILALFCNDNIEQALDNYKTEYDRRTSNPLLGKLHEETIEIAKDNARALEVFDRLDEASKWFEIALESYLELHGPDHELTIDVRYAIAHLKISEESLIEALKDHEEILNWRSTKLGSSNLKTLTSMYTIGEIWLRFGNVQKANELFSDVLRLNVSSHTKAFSLTSKANEKLAQTHYMMIGPVSTCSPSYVVVSKFLKENDLGSLRNWKTLLKPLGLSEAEFLPGQEFEEIINAWTANVGPTANVGRLIDILNNHGYKNTAERIKRKYGDDYFSREPIDDIHTSLTTLIIIGSLPHFINVIVTPWVIAKTRDKKVHKLCGQLDVAFNHIINYPEKTQAVRKSSISLLLIIGYVLQNTFSHEFFEKFWGNLETQFSWPDNVLRSHRSPLNELVFELFHTAGIFLKNSNSNSYELNFQIKFVIKELYLTHPGVKLAIAEVIGVDKEISEVQILKCLLENYNKLRNTGFEDGENLFNEVMKHEPLLVYLKAVKYDHWSFQSLTKWFADMKRLFGSDDEEVLRVAEVLAIKLLSAEMHKESAETWMELYQIKKEKYGIVDKRTLLAADSAIHRFAIAGLNSERLSLLKEIVDKLQAKLGDRHHVTLERKFQLALALEDMNQNDSFDMYQNILPICINILQSKWVISKVKRGFVRVKEAVERVDYVSSFLESLKKQYAISNKLFGERDECTLEVAQEILRVHDSDTIKIHTIVYELMKTEHGNVHPITLEAGVQAADKLPNTDKIAIHTEMVTNCGLELEKRDCRSLERKFDLAKALARDDKRRALKILNEILQISLEDGQEVINESELITKIKREVVRVTVDTANVNVASGFDSFMYEYPVSIELFGEKDECTLELAEEIAKRYASNELFKESAELWKAVYDKHKDQKGRINARTLNAGKEACKSFNKAGMKIQVSQILTEMTKNCEMELGGPDERSLVSRYDLAELLKEEYKEKALCIYKQIMPICMESLGNYNEITTKVKRGFIRLTNNMDGTNKSLEQDLSLCIKVFSEDDECTFKIREELANFLSNIKESAKAWKDVYEKRKVINGKVNERTLKAGDQAALRFVSVWMNTEGIAIRREISANCEDVLGGSDVKTLKSKYDLAYALEKVDKNEAMTIYQPLCIKLLSVDDKTSINVELGILRVINGDHMRGNTDHPSYELKLKSLKKELEISIRELSEFDEHTLDIREEPVRMYDSNGENKENEVESCV